MSYVEPLTSIVLLVLLVGIFRLRRCRGVWLPATAAAGLFVISWPPIDWLLSRPLEVWYPIRPFPPDAAIDGIVVLSAAVSPAQYQRPYALAGRDTYERCEYGAWIYKHRRAVPVLVSGGRFGRDERPIALHMRYLLERAGVPASMILTEEQSRNTYENALFSARVLRERRITKVALVVEAASMLRAEACFRRQGIEVIPAPSSFREWGAPIEEWLPTHEAIKRNERALHEVLGLAWYKIRGRI